MTKRAYTPRLIVYQGRLMPLRDAAPQAGVPYDTALRRIQRGWSGQRILEPPRPYTKH